MAEEIISVPTTPEIVTPDEVRSRSSEGKLIASKSGATTQPNPRRASTGSFGNIGRKFSSGKSNPLSGEESPVPHYLKASTGSCHDFCKYGRKYETEVKPWQNKAKKVRTPKLNQQTGSETEDSSEKKITKDVKSKPPVSKTISRNLSAVSENKVSSTSNLMKDTVVNEKNSVTEKRNTLVLSGRRESELKPVKTKGISKEPMRKLVSSPVAYLATKPSFNRDLGLKFIANTSKKLASPLKDQNKVLKFEIPRSTNNTIKEKTLHVIKVDSKKIVHESKQKENTSNPPLTESSLSPSISSPVKSLTSSYGEEKADDQHEYTPIEKKATEFKQNDSTIDILPSESFLFSNISSPVNSPALSFGEEEAQDELEHASSEKKRPESEQNESSNDAPPSASFSSPNISSPVKYPALSYGDKEVEEELEYFDSETDGTDELIFESTDDEETYIETQNIETRKAEGVSKGNDTATKLKLKRGKVVDIESDNNGPRRLKFRQASVSCDNQVNDKYNRRRSFIKGGDVDDIDNTNDDSERVVLRHQQVESKKDAQGLFNNVIEETATKLVKTRKSKVKALVGAFETVISLQESKPSTPTTP